MDRRLKMNSPIKKHSALKTIGVALISFQLLTTSFLLHSQIVTTLDVNKLNGPNGFALDSKNNLYIANEPGKKIIWLRSDKQVQDSIGSDSPSGLAFDKNDDLYFSNFFSGILLRKKKNHAIDTITNKLNKPSDIKFDKSGNLYVSEYETGLVKRISLDGKVTKFAGGFKSPFGIEFDNEGNLFVANNSGMINKVNSKGEVSVFAQIPSSISYMAYSKKTGKLYVPGFLSHTIYVLSPEGKVEVLCGNGIAGHKDGSLTEAQFEGPNSIAISSNGDLYVSEFSKNRIRKITKVE